MSDNGLAFEAEQFLFRGEEDALERRAWLELSRVATE